MSQETFADLGVSEASVRALASRKIIEPFAIQKLVIADVLAGRDVMAKSPTGSGKTLAFGVPLIDRISAEARRPSALILAPTRELATQIVEELRSVAHARALKITSVYGGVGLQQQGKEAARSHIVVATPGRLEDQLRRRAFDLRNVQMLVLDEADRMLDMGFRPAVDRVVELCPKTRQTLFFSATLDGDAGRVAEQYTRNGVRHEYAPANVQVSKITHRFRAVKHEARIDALVEELNGERELALVFVRTKRGADRLSKRLELAGVKSVAMHGDKSQRQREQALARFESGKVTTLVATDVAARGIDVSGVSHVINFDAPEDREAYVHRVGRTGRAGRTGTGVTFVMPDQARDVGTIARDLKLETEFSETGFSVQAPAPRGGGHNMARNGSRSRRRPAARASR